MYRPGFSLRQDRDQTPSSPSTVEPDSFTQHAIEEHVFPFDFDMDSTHFQQPYNLTTSFAKYAQVSSTEVAPAREVPQQQSTDLASPVAVHQVSLALLPRLSVAQSLIGDEGDDTSEPTSPRDEASERRKEVSGLVSRTRPLLLSVRHPSVALFVHV